MKEALFVEDKVVIIMASMFFALLSEIAKVDEIDRVNEVALVTAISKE